MRDFIQTTKQSKNHSEICLKMKQNSYDHYDKDHNHNHEHEHEHDHHHHYHHHQDYVHSATRQQWIINYLQFKSWKYQCRKLYHNPLYYKNSGNYHHNSAQCLPDFSKSFIILLSLSVWMLSCKVVITSGRHLSNAAIVYNSSDSVYQDILGESNSIPKHTSPPSPHEHSRALKRVFLSNRTTVCNDGTAAGFYLRKNANSKKWIVFLEGGWHCYDTRTCRSRWTRLRHLMTSSQWPETRDMGGILSPLAEENPYWHNANHVLVPYCSSDSWSGTKATPDSTALNFRFMGSLILRQVISDLIPLGLGRIGGAELLLAGSSAGGLGVMLNLDQITNFLQNERQLQVTIRGVSDSGWFLDREPYAPSAVASSDAVRQGWSMWQGALPEACVKQYESEPWRCYFGYRLYPTLKTPLFVFQWLFDEAQMRADNVAAPVTPHQWNYIHAMGGALRASLEKVNAVFAPSCIGHAVLSKREWLTIKIDDVSLPAALRCWEHSTRPRRKRHDKMKRSTETAVPYSARGTEDLTKRTSPIKNRMQREKRKLRRERNQRKQHNNNNNMSEWERAERRRIRQEQRRQHQKTRNRNHRKYSNITNNLINSGDHITGNNSAKTPQKQKNMFNQNNEWNKKHKRINSNKSNYKMKNHKRKQQINSNSNGTSNARSHNEQSSSDTVETVSVTQTQTKPLKPILKESQSTLSVIQRNTANKMNRRSGLPRVPEKCSLRLMERCSWPQCNHSCPTLTNPATGEEMRFLELLASFGLDMEAVATALGVDMQTLNNMDRTELVNLLTQQVS